MPRARHRHADTVGDVRQLRYPAPQYLRPVLSGQALAGYGKRSTHLSGTNCKNLLHIYRRITSDFKKVRNKNAKPVRKNVFTEQNPSNG